MVSIDNQLRKLKKSEVAYNVAKNAKLLLNANTTSKDNSKEAKILDNAGFRSVEFVNNKLDNENNRPINKFEDSKYSNSSYINLCNTFGFDNIFTLDDIRDIAITYNLKYLPTREYDIKLLPNTVPSNINKHNDLINMSGSGISINSYYYSILAPRNNFTFSRKKLENATNSILFSSSYNSKYLIKIDSWGKDINIFNRIKALVVKTKNRIICFNILIPIIGVFIGLGLLSFLEIPSHNGMHVTSMMVITALSIIISFNLVAYDDYSSRFWDNSDNFY